MKCSKCWIWWHKNRVNSDFRSTLIFYIPERNKYPVGLVTHESPLLRARQLILCLLLFDHKVLSDLCRDDPVVHVQDQDYFPGWRNHVWISFEVVQSRERRRTSCDIPPLTCFDYPIDCESHIWVASLICEFCQHSLNCCDEQYQIARGLSRMCTRKITNS